MLPVRNTNPSGWQQQWTVGAASLAWVGCWSAINGGPWLLDRSPVTLTDWANAVRVLIPAAMLVLWLALLSMRRQPLRRPSAAESLWLAYIGLAILAALRLPDLFDRLYWGLAYLAVFVAVEWSLGSAEPLYRARAMNRLNWALTTLLLLMMLVVARDALLVQGRFGMTAHGLVNRADLGQFGPISRSTGMARLAIVPALVGVVFALGRRGPARLFWGALSGGAFLLIWLLQARQGILGSVFASGFVVWLFGGRVRALGLMLMLATGLLILGGLLPRENLLALWTYALRGGGVEVFSSMSGRDVIWRMGWDIVDAAPWWGYGPQADYLVLGWNSQNGLLYAALAAGYPGAILYGAGVLWGWVLFVRAWRRGYAQTHEERLFMLQAGGIMAFLTIRNIPENTAALFSVDLLLHAPLLAWLGTLERVRGPHALRAIPREPSTRERSHA